MLICVNFILMTKLLQFFSYYCILLSILLKDISFLQYLFLGLSAASCIAYAVFVMLESKSDKSNEASKKEEKLQEDFMSSIYDFCDEHGYKDVYFSTENGEAEIVAKIGDELSSITKFAFPANWNDKNEVSSLREHIFEAIKEKMDA